MATEPILATFDVPTVRRPRIASFSTLADYWALTKPEVNFLIVITTFVGFWMGAGTPWKDFPFLLSLHAVVGTLFVASGTGALNQYIERRFDAQMRRTWRRPLAAGRVQPSAVLWFGIGLSVIGSLYLAVAVNALASLLAAFTLLSYLFFYTPFKRKTPLCTLIGAIPGAMPPLIGYAAAAGKLNFEAWMLYAVLFLWQFPHFMAIAWMYREDYDRAGYLVLPRDDRARALFINFQTIFPLLALVLSSVLLAFIGHSSLLGTVASLLTIGFLCYGVRFVVSKSGSTARRLLAASILYLPLLFLLMIVARPR
jgi:protoheme IX farnesyltransferase